MGSFEGGWYCAMWPDRLTLSVVNKTFSHGRTVASVPVDQAGTAVPGTADTSTADPNTAPANRPASAGAASPATGATSPADSTDPARGH